MTGIVLTNAVVQNADGFTEFIYNMFDDGRCKKCGYRKAHFSHDIECNSEGNTNANGNGL